jgi:hypothetical protein
MRRDRNVYDALAREITKPVSRDPVKMTGTTTSGGVDETNQDDAWVNPMIDHYDLIRGGEGGGPVRLPKGAAGQVLTTLIDGTVAWADATGGSGGRYRSPVYTTFGGGQYLFDANGDAIYVLEDLE